MQNKNKDLDLMSIKNLVNLFLKEELKGVKSLLNQKSKITKVINLIKKKLEIGGRVFYIGSGTSGRLGILDAAECKPTFGTDKFKAIIAGGAYAILHAKEGAEDNTRQAIKDLTKNKITKNDVVIGISASGETPYTTSAIKFAKKCRAITIGITSIPKSTLTRIAHHTISPKTKDEIVLGSSRLKAGTIQKIILNLISSITMIKTGNIYKNLMVCIKPTNKKLKERAIRIISIICKAPLNKAKSLFLRAKKDIKAAIVMHCKKCNLKAAKHLLKKSKFNLRKIIDCQP